MAEQPNNIVVQSRVREVVKDFNVSGDFLEALNKKVVTFVKDAEFRAKENGRKTLKPQDL